MKKSALDSVWWKSQPADDINEELDNLDHPGPYSDSRFFDGYKEIRNKLRRYTPHSVLAEGLTYLNKPPPHGYSEAEKQPWVVFLTIKWAFIDEEAETPGKNPISQETLIDVFNSVLKLSNIGRMPDEYDSVRMFMRTLAFQQFPFQANLNGSHFGRQALLFSQLDRNHKLRRQFKMVSGWEIETMLSWLILISGHLLNKPGVPFHASQFDRQQSGGIPSKR